MFADDEVLIYHNPRCSKSRATLQLLRDRGIEPRIIEYLKDPPSPRELEEILSRLRPGPGDIIRKKETEYRAAGADDPELDRDQLLKLMHEHPKLIERPIVVTRGKAALGRPPEKVLDIL